MPVLWQTCGEERSQARDRCAITPSLGKKGGEVEVGKDVRNLIMIGNRGQRRHTEWAKKGGRFRYELAIAWETVAAALEKPSF